jgi:hypothetical protein
MDDDLQSMGREQLVHEVKRLRAGIRTHRDSSGQELCWYHPALWALLPEKTDPLPDIPAWPEFLKGCVRYRQSLDGAAERVIHDDRNAPTPAARRLLCDDPTSSLRPCEPNTSSSMDCSLS